MSKTPVPQRSSGQMSRPVIIGSIVGVGLILVVLFLFLRSRDTEPVPAPEQAPRTTPLETVAPAATGEERGDSAREAIAALRAAPGGVDYDEAYRLAQEFSAAGRVADAQLMLFFAARGGHGPASFDLATLYDPVPRSMGVTVLDKPDPAQAYKWYLKARDAGVAAAQGRLDELRNWVESAAADGDDEAARVLFQMEEAQ